MEAGVNHLGPPMLPLTIRLRSQRLPNGQSLGSSRARTASSHSAATSFDTSLPCVGRGNLWTCRVRINMKGSESIGDRHPSMRHRVTELMRINMADSGLLTPAFEHLPQPRIGQRTSRPEP
jgi:hypothetical protein